MTIRKSLIGVVLGGILVFVGILLPRLPEAEPELTTTVGLSRNDPLPVGSSVIVNDVLIEVASVTRDANYLQLALDVNCNKPPEAMCSFDYRIFTMIGQTTGMVYTPLFCSWRPFQFYGNGRVEVMLWFRAVDEPTVLKIFSGDRCRYSYLALED